LDPTESREEPLFFDEVPLPVFTSHDIDRCNTASEAFDAAKSIRIAFAGPAGIDPEFALGSVIDFTCSPPRRHAFLEVQSCVVNVTMGSPTLTIGPPPGLSTQALESWQERRAEQEYQAKLEAQRTTLEPAFLEPRAVKVLQYLAVAKPGADVLYKIYELLEEHPKKRATFHERFGVSANEFKRFKDSVHNATVSGDWARHAYHETPKTADPMSKGEAESFVSDLAAQWLQHVRVNAPR
jgi:hypothetical protein